MTGHAAHEEGSDLPSSWGRPYPQRSFFLMYILLNRIVHIVLSGPPQHRDSRDPLRVASSAVTFSRIPRPAIWHVYVLELN